MKKVGTMYVSAEKIKQRKKRFKNAKKLALIILLALGLLYVVLALIFNGGDFSIRLQDNLFDHGIVIYEREDDFDFRRRLFAEPLDFMDNISIHWLPENLGDLDGSHNGDNFIAHTFYIENKGNRRVNYWKEIIIDNVTRNVDESIRIMIIPTGGEREVYAKLNSRTGLPEPDTIPFRDDAKIIIRQRRNFTPGTIDRYTVVIWLEGDDPDTTDELIGGQIRMHMMITGEFLD